MNFLNLDLDYFQHPKTKRLVGLLGNGSEVLPIRLWCYCGKYHTESGRFTDHSTQEIESLAEWWGKPGRMVAAMVKVGFLQKEGEDYIVTDWKDYQGHLQAFKERARKAAKARWDKYREENKTLCSSIATSNAQAPPKQCSNHLYQLPKPMIKRSGLSPDFLTKLKNVEDSGFKISCLINQFFNEHKLAVEVPEAAFITVFDAFMKYKPVKPWPYFKKVLKGEVEKYCISLQKDYAKTGEVKNEEGIRKLKELIKEINI